MMYDNVLLFPGIKHAQAIENNCVCGIANIITQVRVRCVMDSVVRKVCIVRVCVYGCLFVCSFVCVGLFVLSHLLEVVDLGDILGLDGL